MNSSKSKSSSSLFSFSWTKKKATSEGKEAAITKAPPSAANSPAPPSSKKASKKGKNKPKDETKPSSSGLSIFASLFGTKQKKDTKAETSNASAAKKDSKSPPPASSSSASKQLPASKPPVDKHNTSATTATTTPPTSNLHSTNTSPTDLNVSSTSNDAFERPPIAPMRKLVSADAASQQAATTKPSAMKKNHRRELSLEGIKIPPSPEDPRISFYMRKENNSTDPEDSLPPTPQHTLSKTASTGSHQGKGHRRSQSHNLNLSQEQGISIAQRDAIIRSNSSLSSNGGLPSGRAASLRLSKSGSRTTVDRISSMTLTNSTSMSGSFHGSLHNRTLSPTQSYNANVRVASPGPPMDEFGGTVTYSDPNLSDERELANLINQGYRREDAIKMIFDRNFNQLNRINSNNSNHNSAYELGHSASMSFYKSQALQRTPSTQSMDAFNPNASGYSVGSVAISSNHSSMHGQSMQNIPTMPLNPSPAQLYHTPPQQPGHSVQVISPVARVPPMIPQLALHNGMTPTTPSRPSKITPRAMPTTPPPQISPRMMQQSSPAPLPAPGAVFHQVAAQYVASNATSPTPAVRTNEAEVEALRLAIQESLADASPLRPTDEEIERLAIDKANEQALQEALQASMEEMKDCPLRKAKSQRMSVAIERANEEALRRALRRSMFERKGVVSTPPPGSLSPRRTQLSAEKAEEMRQQREEYIMQNEHSQSFFGESETGIVGHNVSSNASCYSDASVRSENTHESTLSFGMQGSLIDC